MQITLEKVIEAPHNSWAADTAYADDWGKDNPARNQCVVSSLVINDYFNGDFQKYKVYGEIEETHYCNKLWGKALVDTTAQQYNGWRVQLNPVEMNLEGYKNCREKLLSNTDTHRKYLLLKSRVEEYLQKP